MTALLLARHPSVGVTVEAIDAFAQHVLASQPFSRLLGTRLLSCAPGFVELGLELDDRLTQQHGFAHGGVISYLADNSITFAGGLALEGDALTSEFKINYLRPAVGIRLIARARARTAGRRQAVCVSEIFVVGDGDDERLCAIAQGTVLPAGAPGAPAGQGSAGMEER